MLRAIEEEHFDQLPGGVFNKGFIRAYAKHLGINDQEAVDEYLECLRQEQIKAQAVWEPPAQPVAPVKRPLIAINHKILKTQDPPRAEELPELQLPRPEHVRPPRYKYLDRGEGGIPLRLVAVAVLVIVLAILLWRRHPGRGGEKTTSAAPPTPASIAPPVPTTTAPTTTVPTTTAPTTLPASSPGAVPAGAPSSDRAAGSAPARPAVGVTASTPASHPPGSAATAASTVKPAADSEENDVETRSRAAMAAEPAAKPAGLLTLVIRASENSWISVSADGQTVSQETLIAPAHTFVHANREIVAKVGNAAGVTFLWNGKGIPAQGEEGEVKTFVFDAQGMRVVAASLAPAPNQ
jgi:cytoskeleton protein RodZ